MSQETDPAVWETKLRKLLFCEGTEGRLVIPAATAHIIGVLAQQLAEDDEVELNPISYREFRLRLKRQKGVFSYELNPSMIIEAVEKYAYINENVLECEEVTDG